MWWGLMLSLLLTMLGTITVSGHLVLYDSGNLRGVKAEPLVILGVLLLVLLVEGGVFEVHDFLSSSVCAQAGK